MKASLNTFKNRICSMKMGQYLKHLEFPKKFIDVQFIFKNLKIQTWDASSMSAFTINLGYVHVGCITYFLYKAFRTHLDIGYNGLGTFLVF